MILKLNLRKNLYKMKYTNEHIMQELIKLNSGQEVVKVQVKDLTKTIKGNGQPGLVQKLELNESKLDRHLIKDTEWKGKKDGSIIGIKWVIGLGLSLLTIAVAIFSFI